MKVKVLQLNIWMGGFYDPLMSFLKEWNNEVDIFCLQEVLDDGDPFASLPGGYDVRRKTLYRDLQKLFSDYTPFFSEMHDRFGIAMFVNKRFSVLEEKKVIIVDGINDEDNEFKGRPLHAVKILNEEGTGWVAHCHGFWLSGSKDDTPIRQQQSMRILNAFNGIREPIILCGDFNLNPHTKSIALLEGRFMNLIKEYNITNTRGSFGGTKGSYADYIFVSKEVYVHEFSVLQEQVSDHLALLLSCSMKEL